MPWGGHILATCPSLYPALSPSGDSLLLSVPPAVSECVMGRTGVGPTFLAV
jgi:hypothetical protein